MLPEGMEGSQGPREMITAPEVWSRATGASLVDAPKRLGVRILQGVRRRVALFFVAVVTVTVALVIPRHIIALGRGLLPLARRRRARVVVIELLGNGRGRRASSAKVFTLVRSPIYKGGRWRHRPASGPESREETSNSLAQCAPGCSDNLAVMISILR